MVDWLNEQGLERYLLNDVSYDEPERSYPRRFELVSRIKRYKQDLPGDEEILRCPECGWVGHGVDVETDKLYECESCGAKFSESNSSDGGSSRCPQCNKFSHKLADYCCPECYEGELEEATEEELKEYQDNE